MKILYLTKYSRNAGSSRLRSYQYFPFLEEQGLSYLFDTRGFAFDERADVGSVKKGSLVFKIFNHLEDYDFVEIFKGMRSADISKKCRSLAEECFSVDEGAKEYRVLYEQIFQK
ncbi:hypothetical protein G5B00_08430 [Parapedobacter sp. SGR-10]|uniref:hypothetical protein n=1 Tax=Parapedobacter sp. SGR-10 TaxID=2710879 RepID=UPI0013D2AC5F|nr:hypothetical protein [Parapedobacter sp. SGR-10]NGF56541.1 hypothetical protein [Parapedobacter sp. SGR-10]